MLYLTKGSALLEGNAPLALHPSVLDYSHVMLRNKSCDCFGQSFKNNNNVMPSHVM